MEKRIFEVNGLKIEVDERHIKVIDSYKIGDPVKVLRKNYSDYQSHPGVIIGFDAFQKLPTLIVAYLEVTYNPDIKFVFLNSQTKDVEICPANSNELFLDKQLVLDRLDSDVIKKQQEISDIKNKRNYFLQHFNKFFHQTIEEKSEVNN